MSFPKHYQQGCQRVEAPNLPCPPPSGCVVELETVGKGNGAMTCPLCNWPEFTPVRRVTRVRDGALSRLLAAIRGRPLTKRSGDIVCCAKCTVQYVLSGVVGAYKITGTDEPRVRREESSAAVQHLADGDQPWD